jgi:hypothetical protein
VPNSVRRASAKYAIASRYNEPGTPVVVEAHRDWAFENIRDHVQKIVGTAPPLTESQRARITAALVRSPNGGDDRTRVTR